MVSSPARWIVWIHQLHVAGGVSGSAIMVAVFLEVVVVLWPLANLSYVDFGTKNLKERLTMLPSAPPWPAPYLHERQREIQLARRRWK
jgi:hypothetical protein